MSYNNLCPSMSISNTQPATFKAEQTEQYRHELKLTRRRALDSLTPERADTLPVGHVVAVTWCSQLIDPGRWVLKINDRSSGRLLIKWYSNSFWALEVAKRYCRIRYRVADAAPEELQTVQIVQTV